MHSVTFTLPAPTLAIIVLSRLDERYFRDISNRAYWNLNFVLVKDGEKEPLAESVHAVFWSRSVNLEIDLEPGKYFVYVSLPKVSTKLLTKTISYRLGSTDNLTITPSTSQPSMTGSYANFRMLWLRVPKVDPSPPVSFLPSASTSTIFNLKYSPT
jgi:hypothetical protein